MLRRNHLRHRLPSMGMIETQVLAADIRSEKKTAREEYLNEGGRTGILKNGLFTARWILDFKNNSNDCVRNLFFDSKSWVELLQANLDVLLMAARIHVT